MNYISSHFDEHITSTYTLSIRFRTDGFSFMIHCNEELLVVKECDLTQQLLNVALEQTSYLKFPYKEVFILLEQKSKLLVPESCFIPENAAAIYQYVLPLTSDELLFYNHDKINKLFVVQKCTTFFYETLKNAFGSFNLVSSLYVLLQQATTISSSNTADVFVEIHDDYFDLIILKEKKPDFYNSYSYQSVTDIIYFLNNALTKKGIEPSSTIHVSGIITEKTKIIEKYFSTVIYSKSEELLRLCDTPRLKQADYINLLSIHQCEL